MDTQGRLRMLPRKIKCWPPVYGSRLRLSVIHMTRIDWQSHGLGRREGGHGLDHSNEQPVMHISTQEPAMEGFPVVALLASDIAALGAHCLSHKCTQREEKPDAQKSSCIEGTAQ